MSLMISTLLSGLCLLGAIPAWQDEVDRLVGHTVEVADDGYRIVDIAGEGEPYAGCIRLVGKSLYLESGDLRWRLTGPLAVPRIAGPNYRVWVIGTPTPAKTLPATRLGILATPTQSICGAEPQAVPATK